MKTYPEMNEQIVSILRLRDDAISLYAAARIEELETRNIKSASLVTSELAGLLERLAEWADDAVIDSGSCFTEDMGTSEYASENPGFGCDSISARQIATAIRETSKENPIKQCDSECQTRIEELEQKLEEAEYTSLAQRITIEELECKQQKILLRCPEDERIKELERQLVDAALTIHIYEKSLCEYAQTVYRLRKKLEAKRQPPRVAPAWLRRYEEVG